MQKANYQDLSKEELIELLEKVQHYSGKGQIRYPQDVLPFTKNIVKKGQEHFMVLYLNGQHSVISKKIISIGTANRTIVHPRDIFAEAVKKNAVAIIIVHNHPSGNPQPSTEDTQITERIKNAGDIMGISLLDHMVVCKNGYYSYLEKGAL